jgi:hypothetical protein
LLRKYLLCSLIELNHISATTPPPPPEIYRTTTSRSRRPTANPCDGDNQLRDPRLRFQPGESALAIVSRQRLSGRDESSYEQLFWLLLLLRASPIICVGQNGNRAAGVPVVRLKFRHVASNISSQPMHRIEEEVHVTMLVSGQVPSPRWRLPGEAQVRPAKNRVF